MCRYHKDGVVCVGITRRFRDNRCPGQYDPSDAGLQLPPSGEGVRYSQSYCVVMYTCMLMHGLPSMRMGYSLGGLLYCSLLYCHPSVLRLPRQRRAERR